ncbi:hypothetical protein SNEBB_008695 [Seison nebaliae]|nr:hypothetical protein SNEBB_008695 [Seison nebaliae]
MYLKSFIYLNCLLILVWASDEQITLNIPETIEFGKEYIVSCTHPKYAKLYVCPNKLNKNCESIVNKKGVKVQKNKENVEYTFKWTAELGFNPGKYFICNSTEPTVPQSEFLQAIVPNHNSFPKSYNDDTVAIEGESLKLSCGHIYGNKPENVKWVFFDSKLDEPRCSNSSKSLGDSDEFTVDKINDGKSGSLKINEVKNEHRGTYVCCVRNETLSDDVPFLHYFVRVKGKLAALWPFLGIVAEVIILCAVILIYEKQRDKKRKKTKNLDGGDKLVDSTGQAIS